MAKIKKFLNQYDTILFDMDGVITSEQSYWTCSALCVYEMLVSEEYYGNKKIDRLDLYKNRQQIRKEVFCFDKTICEVKNKGVNSNWDLAYVVLAEALICDTHDFECVYNNICKFDGEAFEYYDMLANSLAKKCKKSVGEFERLGKLWCQIQELFQKWYIGDKNTPAIMGDEKPLLGMDITKEVLSVLKQEGKSLGIGTGRPTCEVENPLKAWGVWELFDESRIVTYDDVISAEEYMLSMGEQMTLTKPHPFMFLKGAFTKQYPIKKLMDGDFDNQILKKTLVVGDAGSDILAAQAGNMDFLAVLTGISGQAARKYFEKQGANYILDSICDMIE